MRRLPRKWLSAACLALAAAISPFSAGAQDDPFASSGETSASTDSPFESAPATGAEAAPAAPPAAPVDPNNPFDDPAAAGFDDPSRRVDPANPFVTEEPAAATPAPVPDTSDPFGDTVPSEFVPPPRVDMDPFAIGGAPSSAPQPMAGGSRVPLGRPELKYDDQQLRRAAEIRGLYLVATNRGLQDEAQLTQLAADFRAGDFNRLYAETRTVYGCVYRSALEPSLPYISESNSNPLRKLRPQLGQTGNIVAVVSLLPAYDASVSSRPGSGTVAAKHPDFLTRSVSGDVIAPDNLMYLDPGNPEVRQYLASLVVEIEREVQPAVYLFRGLAYPGRDWGYSEGAIAAFRSQVGGQGPPPPDDPVWCAWRREQIVETIRTIRRELDKVRPGSFLGVEVPLEGPPPESWDAWLASPTYSERMQDWIGWARKGLVSELCFTIHERVQPQGNVLPDWLPFVNSNVGEVRPIFSLAGYLNRREGLRTQFDLTRERAVGTVLFHYTDPSRDVTRGFFPSLADTLFRGAPGNPIGDREIAGPAEDRIFSPMGAPPPAIEATPTPDYGRLADPLAGQKLIFLTPTPQPTRTPLPAMVPQAIARKLTLRNGRRIEAVVLEATSESLVIRDAKHDKAPAVKLARSSVATIEPPL